jgi:hypothetical protein
MFIVIAVISVYAAVLFSALLFVCLSPCFSNKYV